STLTVGVISAKGRELRGLGRGTTNYADLLQTDASINPGNSGGPLVNIDSEVVGINVAISAQGAGIGFAIPVNLARQVSDQLIERGRVTRGYLGVQSDADHRALPQELRQHLNAPNGGALLEGVQPNGPADRAGVKGGDVIVRFGDREIRSFTDLENAVAQTRPGATVPLEVVRDGKPVRLRITVVERPSEDDLVRNLTRPEAGGNEPAQGEATRLRYGLMVRPAEGRNAVEVVGVERGSPAFEAGIRPGELIERVGRTATPTIPALSDALARAAGPAGIVVQVRTNSGGTRFPVIKP
ncbi:MAG: PDZ domain-containing protein, partial [Armatimonadetes bacterium]|nr:PDZ domain-containing protein [Armatimonadota bacterium]